MGVDSSNPWREAGSNASWAIQLFNENVPVGSLVLVHNHLDTGDNPYAAVPVGSPAQMHKDRPTFLTRSAGGIAVPLGDVVGVIEYSRGPTGEELDILRDVYRTEPEVIRRGCGGNWVARVTPGDEGGVIRVEKEVDRLTTTTRITVTYTAAEGMPGVLMGTRLRVEVDPKKPEQLQDVLEAAVAAFEDLLERLRPFSEGGTCEALVSFETF